MSQAQLAKEFTDLHVKGDPIILYNIWDAGSAKAVCKAGARALATGSWSVAAAQGYDDGESLPLDTLLGIITRIVQTVDVPVSVDFEGGYAAAPDPLARNTTRLLDTGVIGMNFEDRIVAGEGLYAIPVQSERIRAIRKTAEERQIPLFLNARTDLFLKEKDPHNHSAFMADAKDRAKAYAEAGASGFFVPGLIDPDLIEEICAASPLPVNVMKSRTCPNLETLRRVGVGRVSYGPYPYFNAVEDLVERYNSITEN